MESRARNRNPFSPFCRSIVPQRERMPPRASGDFRDLVINLLRCTRPSRASRGSLVGGRASFGHRNPVRVARLSRSDSGAPDRVRAAAATPVLREGKLGRPCGAQGAAPVHPQPPVGGRGRVLRATVAAQGAGRVALVLARNHLRRPERPQDQPVPRAHGVQGEYARSLRKRRQGREPDTPCVPVGGRSWRRRRRHAEGESRRQRCAPVVPLLRSLGHSRHCCCCCCRRNNRWSSVAGPVIESNEEPRVLGSPSTRPFDVPEPCTRAFDVPGPCTRAVNVPGPCTRAVDGEHEPEPGVGRARCGLSRGSELCRVCRGQLGHDSDPVAHGRLARERGELQHAEDGRRGNPCGPRSVLLAPADDGGTHTRRKALAVVPGQSVEPSRVGGGGRRGPDGRGGRLRHPAATSGVGDRGRRRAPLALAHRVERLQRRYASPGSPRVARGGVESGGGAARGDQPAPLSMEPFTTTLAVHTHRTHSLSLSQTLYKDTPSAPPSTCTSATASPG